MTVQERRLDDAPCDSAGSTQAAGVISQVPRDQGFDGAACHEADDAIEIAGQVANRADVTPLVRTAANTRLTRIQTGNVPPAG